MKEHNGMRAHDILILLQIICLDKTSWHNKDLAYSLKISASEISESLNRSWIAKLLDSRKKHVNKMALMDFLAYGLPYTFPQVPKTLARGIATSHSASPLNQFFNAKLDFIWPYAKGNLQGLTIKPLHKNVPLIVHTNPKLHEMLALVDALRVGRAREKKMAIDLLRKIILQDVEK